MSDNTHNTLHLCHLDSITSLEPYRNLIKSNDAVVFYTSSWSNQRAKEITEQFQQCLHYFVYEGDDASADTAITLITYDQWVDLTDQYTKTFSWK